MRKEKRFNIVFDSVQKQRKNRRISDIYSKDKRKEERNVYLNLFVYLIFVCTLKFQKERKNINVSSV